jgi:hypothetical protein
MDFGLSLFDDGDRFRSSAMMVRVGAERLTRNYYSEADLIPARRSIR